MTRHEARGEIEAILPLQDEWNALPIEEQRRIAVEEVVLRDAMAYTLREGRFEEFAAIYAYRHRATDEGDAA